MRTAPSLRILRRHTHALDGQAVAEDAATDEYAADEEERTSSTTVQRH